MRMRMVKVLSDLKPISESCRLVIFCKRNFFLRNVCEENLTNFHVKKFILRETPKVTIEVKFSF